MNILRIRSFIKKLPVAGIAVIRLKYIINIVRNKYKIMVRGLSGCKNQKRRPVVGKRKN